MSLYSQLIFAQYVVDTFEALKQLPCQESLAEVIDKLTDIFMVRCFFFHYEIYLSSVYMNV